LLKDPENLRALQRLDRLDAVGFGEDIRAKARIEDPRRGQIPPHCLRGGRIACETAQLFPTGRKRVGGLFAVDREQSIPKVK